MLYFTLGPIFKARNINRPHHFLVNAGMSPFTASQFVNGKVSSFKLANIELLCKVLYCEPSELLSFAPNKDEIYPEDHPLLNLKKQADENSFQDIIANMPFKQVKQLTQTIIDNNKEEDKEL